MKYWLFVSICLQSRPSSLERNTHDTGGAPARKATEVSGHAGLITLSS